MSGAATKVGHGLAKVLGIKLQYRDQGHLSRGESVFSTSTDDTFVEREPTSGEWLREILPTPRIMLDWAYHLFPFVHWIDRYNVNWLVGDLVAGQSPCPGRPRELSIDD